MGPPWIERSLVTMTGIGASNLPKPRMIRSLGFFL